MPDFRERSNFKNVAMEAYGLGGAALASQIVFELLDLNPNVGYLFHIQADSKAKQYIQTYVSHFGVSDVVKIVEPVDNFSDWIHSKDIYIILPSNEYDSTDALFPLSMGLKAYIPFSEDDIYTEMDDIYKYQTTTDLISKVIEGKGSSVQSAQIALKLHEELS